ncbi:SHOCT domain-containing protein [Halobellus rufus]|uniref:SHOCT domain-containing protein n=1 Tax=Halobellus rufus TaxID=1448860 RepID=UPI0006792856|nr:SHOCT domain-containing protein [Halobellus rufus]
MVRGERDGDRREWEAGFSDSDDPVVGATALLVLGAGLGSLFGVPVLEAVDFWVVFVIGYAVVVPLVSLLRGESTDGSDPRSDRPDAAGERRRSESGSEGVDVALERLRERYARGDLSEEQFERKLEALLATDTPENARERVERSRQRVDDAGDAGESDVGPGDRDAGVERAGGERSR